MIVLVFILILAQTILIGLSLLYNSKLLRKYDDAIKSVKSANEKNNSIIIEKLNTLDRRLSNNIKEQCIITSNKIKEFVNNEHKDINKSIVSQLTKIERELNQNFINTNNSIAENKISEKSINSLCEKINTLNDNYGSYKNINFRELILNLASLSTNFNNYKKSHNEVVHNMNKALDKSNDLLTNNKVNFDKIVNTLRNTELSVNKLASVVDEKLTTKRKRPANSKVTEGNKSDVVKDRPTK